MAKTETSPSLKQKHRRCYTKKSLFCWCSRKSSWLFSEIFVVVLGNVRGRSRKFSWLLLEIFVVFKSTLSIVRASNIQQYRHPKCNIFVLIYFQFFLLFWFLHSNVKFSLFTNSFFPHHLSSTTYFQFRMLSSLCCFDCHIKFCLNFILRFPRLCWNKTSSWVNIFSIICQ